MLDSSLFIIIKSSFIYQILCLFFVYNLRLMLHESMFDVVSFRLAALTVDATQMFIGRALRYVVNAVVLTQPLARNAEVIELS